jgi:hypothetical protein
VDAGDAHILHPPSPGQSTPEPSAQHQQLPFSPGLVSHQPGWGMKGLGLGSDVARLDVAFCGITLNRPCGGGNRHSEADTKTIASRARVAVAQAVMAL